MEQSPSWAATMYSASQGIPCTVWNPTFCYFIHKILPPVPTPSQMNPVHVSIPVLKDPF